MRMLFILFTCFCSFSTLAQHQFHHPSEFVKQLKGKKDQGQKVYASFCSNCHNKKPLINLGAPRIGVKADWESRLKQSSSEMMKKVMEGVGAMPAMGGCFECDDNMLTSAVLFMLPHETKK